MGNNICADYSKDPGFISDNPLQILSDKQNSLSQKIQLFLNKQKPYQHQLSQKQLKLKKIGRNFYQGELNSFGNPHGVGKLYRSDGSLFVGKFLKGQASGMGYLIFPNGDHYQGFFMKSLPDDPKGKMISQQSAYLGGYKNNQLHGEGQFVSELIHYKGQFRNGKMSKGILKWKAEKKGFENHYEGEFDSDQKFTGQGQLVTKEGTYRGGFLQGKKHGYGIFSYKNEQRFEGIYNKDLKEGEGVLKNVKGKVIYKGHWKNNLPNGKGFQQDGNGGLVEGEYIDGIESKTLIKV